MFHNFIRLHCTSCGHEIDVPVYCGDRFCPICSISRMSRVKARINFFVKNNLPQDGAGFKHLTLTIPSRPDLPGMIKFINHSFRKLRNTKLWKSSILGGAYVCEITHSAEGWHAHLHAIIFGYWIDWYKLRDLWNKCSGGSGVYIQAIPEKTIVRYLTKYLTKPQVPEELLPEVNLEIKGYRLFAPFGSWFNLAKTYVKPACSCRKCNAGEFVNVHVELGQGFGGFWKEVNLNEILYEKDLKPDGPEISYLAEFDIDDFPFGKNVSNEL